MAQRLVLSLERQGRAVASITRDSRHHKLVRLGTLASTDLPLADEQACRLHAFIELGSREATLIDLGTLTGTELNAVRTRRAKLANGDQIGIGRSTIRVGLTPIYETPLPLPETAVGFPLPAPAVAIAPQIAIPTVPPADLPIAPPVDVPAAPPVDATVRVDRGVGSDWRAKDYVRRETYDTRALVARMRRERRRSRLGATGSLAAVLLVLGAPVGWRVFNEVEAAKERPPAAAVGQVTAGAATAPAAPRPVVEPPIAPAAPPPVVTYEVRAGDTLGRIARQRLGDRNRWPELFEANRDRLDDPAALPVGLRLRLP